MDIRKFEIDTRSYPRYSYTSSEVSRFYRRFHHLMTKTELDGSNYPVYTYSNPHIYIIQHQHNSDVDLQPLWLLHKHRQYDVAKPELFTSVDVLHRENITSTTEKVIIYVTSGTQPIPAWLEEFALNCIIVTKSDHSAANIRDKHSYIVSSSVPIVVMTGTEADSNDLAAQIDGVLERIVFRRLNLLLKVLKEARVIEKKQTIKDALTDQLDKHTGNIFIPRANILQGWVREIQNGQTEDSELRDVEEALVDVSVDTTVHGSICVLLHRIGRDISVKVEQFIQGHYLQIPDKVRGLFPVQTEPGVVATSVYNHTVNILANEFLKDPHDDDEDADVLGKVVEQLRRKSERASLIQTIKTTANKLMFVTEVDRRIRNIQDLYELCFHRLVWEIKGAYYRSKVPRTEQPDSGNESKTLSPKVARRLFEKVGAVGTGYRCDKLHVYVREHSGIDEHEVNKDVKNVLAEFQITDFRVILSKETVTHFKRVGAKIKVSRKGTLGGFAWMDDDNSPGEQNGRQLCALMSKHVVNGANKVFWLPDKNGDQIHIGSVIQVDTDTHQLTNPYIDVAAALILPTQQQQCDLKFRNSREEPSPCRLYDFTDLKYLEGLTVHLSGATTPLGIGKITIPDYICPGSDPDTVIHYIVVEDIDDPDQPERFSQEGDSGSVICGDTGDGECVDVIAMLIGCINYEETGQPGQYLAFRMTDGLNKLGAETHRPFSLCTEYN